MGSETVNSISSLYADLLPAPPFVLFTTQIFPKASIWSRKKKDSLFRAWRRLTLCVMCVWVVLCCADRCQWQSDASQWAHVGDYVRNWTEQSTLNRFFCHRTNGVDTFDFLVFCNRTKQKPEKDHTLALRTAKQKQIFLRAERLHGLSVQTPGALRWLANVHWAPIFLQHVQLFVLLHELSI